MSHPKENKYNKYFLPSLIVIGIFMSVACIMLYTKVQENIYVKTMKREAQKHINLLHKYYDKSGSIPSNYYTDDESIIYLKESDTSFIVYFILGFDESVTYHSNTRCWNIE